jgi:hypothetical protein
MNLWELNTMETSELEQQETELLNKITSWDKEDVTEMRQMIVEMAVVSRVLGRKETDRLNIAALPSDTIQYSCVGYPIWCMDKNHMCLCGADARDIKHLFDIAAEQLEAKGGWNKTE